MSTALLTVFIDSAKNLPVTNLQPKLFMLKTLIIIQLQQARQQSKPDPYLLLSVGKQNEQTGVQMRTDEPVWEQGFTFLVGNPDNDTLQLKIMDQKTDKEIGRFTYILSALLEKQNLEIVSQPFQLQKSGPESKITMSMSLRIFKKSENIDEDAVSISSSDRVSSSGPSEINVSRQSSIKTLPEVKQQQDARVSTSSAGGETTSVQEEPFEITSSSVFQSGRDSSDNSETGSTLLHRTPSTTSSAGFAGLGRIQLTTRYSVQRQRLVIIVHKIMNIPLKDPTNIPDPYVKIYLLPGRSKESKRKTNVVKDNCNPVYDATFEYIISSAELLMSELEVTVATQKGFLSGGSPVIGIVKLPLNDSEITQQGVTSWYDLLPEAKQD